MSTAPPKTRRPHPRAGRPLRRLAGAAAILVGLGAQVPAPEPQPIRIGLIDRALPRPPLYDFDAVPVDEGVAGATVGIADNNTTGRLTGQRFSLEHASLAGEETAVAAARRLVEQGAGLLVLNLGAEDIVAVADAVADRDVLVLNMRAEDERLRGPDCRANLFHVAPSRSMLADGLAQFLAAKRWRNLFLVVGPKTEDRLYGDAVRQAARKFGLKIVAEKAWTFGPLARARADSPTQAEALVFTRGVEADVLVVADEAGDFGEYVPYHTWDPKLVAGTQGLVATTWHRAHDAWGSAQLQSRFVRSAGRGMRPLDYQAWTAVRAVGEAATRARSGDPADIARTLRAPDFQLAAFKGVALSFRPWDRQLRQPLLIAQPMAVVSISPQAGFLHQRTPLDTLGADQPESACKIP